MLHSLRLSLSLPPAFDPRDGHLRVFFTHPTDEPGPDSQHPTSPKPSFIRTRKCTRRTQHQSGTCERSQVRTPPSPLRTSRSQPALPCPLPSLSTILSQTLLLLLQRMKNVMSTAYYRRCERVCLLDPKAPIALSPADGDADNNNNNSSSSSLTLHPFFCSSGLFSDRSGLGHPRCVVRLRRYKAWLRSRTCVDGLRRLIVRSFGTGDDSLRGRTAELRALGFPTRHPGLVQMTTETSLGVTKRVICPRQPLYVTREAHCAPCRQ